MADEQPRGVRVLFNSAVPVDVGITREYPKATYWDIGENGNYLILDTGGTLYAEFQAGFVLGFEPIYA